MATKTVSKFAHLYRTTLTRSIRDSVMWQFKQEVRDPLQLKIDKMDHDMVEKAYQHRLKELPTVVRKEAALVRASPASRGTYLNVQHWATATFKVAEGDSGRVGGAGLLLFRANNVTNRLAGSFVGVYDLTFEKGHPLYEEALAIGEERDRLSKAYIDTRTALENALRKHKYIGRLLDEYPDLKRFFSAAILNTPPANAGAVVSAATAADLKAMMDSIYAAVKPAPQPRKAASKK